MTARHPGPRPGAREGAAAARRGTAAKTRHDARRNTRSGASHESPGDGHFTVNLRPGRERSLELRHPWIFSGAVADCTPDCTPGATVRVVDAGGSFLARAAWSPASQIRARVWSFEPDEAIDDAFFRRRVESALARRLPCLDARHNACRLVHGESDGLPGVIVDRYADVGVVQLLSMGADFQRQRIADALLAAGGLQALYERSDAEVRALEGLPAVTGALRGSAPSSLEIVEDGLRYCVDLAGGQKTGFYLDQRDNRRLLRSLAANREVLNAFCYTGAFTLAMLAGGARRALSLDTSRDALALARKNAALNGLADAPSEWREADVFSELRTLRDRGAHFDLIVLDPPKFAPTAQHAERASRAYKDINLLALKLLTPGGLLATFSCSGGISAELFQKIVAGAALDARVDATIVARLQAGADHPVLLSFPEGEYLKGLLLRKPG